MSAVKEKSRFSTKYHSGSADEFQAGSRKRVLKNLLGYTSVSDIEDAELLGYLSAEKKLIGEVTSSQKFTARDVDRIHKYFLGHVYSWAGTYRTANLTKGGFMFAAAMAIPTMMEEFEKKVLKRNTPCKGKTLDEIVYKIAIVHVEFLLIHPYREGNGRTARLLAALMAYQAGLPGIDFGFIGSRGKEFNRYIAAIQHGLERDYSFMQEIVLIALKRALRSAKRL
jgi:cell filamentation protein